MKGPPTLTYIPVRRHTHQSHVNMARLPAEVLGVRRAGNNVSLIPVSIKNEAGELRDSASQGSDSQGRQLLRGEDQ